MSTAAVTADAPEYRGALGSVFCTITLLIVPLQEEEPAK